MAGFETRAIHAGQDPDPQTGAVVPPLSLSTTFAQPTVGELPAGYDYSRSGNPTRSLLEAQLANLEGADHGFAFASGLAAEDAILRVISNKDHLVIPHDAYGGTYRLVSKVHNPAGLAFTPADMTNETALADAWQDNTKMVWVETPTNPKLSVVDIEFIASFAHARGALLVVDNTFATPYLQQPLELGADIVIHSSTKYLGGHSDVVGGFVATSNSEIAEKIGFLQNAAGAVASPFDCYLVSRGTKTLAVRMDRHCENAATVAAFLEGHDKVDTVIYPGLESHPDYKVAAKQMRGFGGMLSFTVKGGEGAALQLVTKTKLFTLAESLGAVESLIEHPGKMTHASVAGSPLEVDSALIRVSVGIETKQDLIDDLGQALQSI